MNALSRTLLLSAMAIAYAGAVLAQTATGTNGSASTVPQSGQLAAPNAGAATAVAPSASAPHRKIPKRKNATRDGNHFSSGSTHALGFDNGSSTSGANDTSTGIGVTSSGSSATGTGGSH